MKFLKYFLVLVLTAGAATSGFFLAKNNLLRENVQSGQITGSPTQAFSPTVTPAAEKTLGEFTVTNKDLLTENGRPAVYFYGTSTCPHCVWEKPVAKKVFSQFGSEIAYHEMFDPKNEADFRVFQQFQEYNPEGGVPFLIIGGKYVRAGSGQNLGKTDEESKKLEEEAKWAGQIKVTAIRETRAVGVAR